MAYLTHLVSFCWHLYKVRGLKPSTEDTDDEISVQYSATDSESEIEQGDNDDSEEGHEEEDREGSIIPIQLQIHPFYMHREPSNMFRLFFIRGKLQAVCHVSLWTYYTDIYSYRASVVKAIANYSRSLTCAQLLKSIMDNSVEKGSAATTATPSSVPPMLNAARKMPSLSRMTSHVGGSSKSLLDTKPEGSCMSIRVPDEKVLFDGKPEMKSSVLTSKEYKSVEEKYGFLKRMFSWKKFKRTTKRHVDLKPGQPDVSAPTVEELRSRELVGSTDSLVTDRRVMRMPPPKELMGSTIYSLCCAQVPQCTLSEGAKKKLVCDCFKLHGTTSYTKLTFAPLTFRSTTEAMTDSEPF